MEVSFSVGEPATEPAAEPETRMPLNESTSLLPVARSFNWRQKCTKYFYWAGFFVYFLLLLAEVVVSIYNDVSVLCRYFKIIANASENSSLASPPPSDEIKEGIASDVIDILICWIFLTVVARSPRFVGCFTVLKNLIRLPRFWTLVFLLGLYIVGGHGIFLLPLVRRRSIALQNQEATSKVIKEIKEIKLIDFQIALVVIDVLDMFTKVVLVGVLNYVQVRNVARSRHTYWLLKGALVVTLFRQIVVLLSAIVTVYLSLLSSTSTDNSHRSLVDSPSFNLAQLFLLPLATKTTELIWTKLFKDNKSIIGKCESNSLKQESKVT